MSKRAILVVSFGSSYEEARKKAIEPIENLIQETFKDYDVERAFTSHIIIKKLKKTGIHIDTPEEALEKLIQKGYQEIILQPLHILTGFEFEKIERAVEAYQTSQVEIKLGKPLLFDEEDYGKAIEALKTQLPIARKDQAVVLVGHGTDHEANGSYLLLQRYLEEQQLPVIVGTIDEGVEGILEALEAGNYKEIALMPFMVVAGDHVFNDLVGTDSDAWKNQMEEMGYTVEAYTKGIGENKAFQELYVQHIRDTLACN